MRAGPTEALLSLLLASLLSVALTGCGAEEEAAVGSVPTAGVPARGSTPTTPAAPGTGTPPTGTTTGSQARAGIPANARANTQTAAIAFTRHYLGQMVRTAVRPTVGVLPTLSSPTCKTCANLEGNVRYLATHGEHNETGGLHVRTTVRRLDKPGMVIEAFTDSDRIVVRSNADNTTRRTYPAVLNEGFVFYLNWTAGGWRVAEIKIDSTAVQK